jgi:Iron-containing redox enzyme
LSKTSGAQLPRARGPLSEHVLTALRLGRPLAQSHPTIDDDALEGDDLHLALYVCYELHYEGFDGVDPSWEWEPSLLDFRRQLEAAFENALLSSVPVEDVTPAPRTADAILELIAADDGPPLAAFIESTASLEQFKEFVIHRSAYQLKEADPHSWVIPRLRGPGKAALVEIQGDEYGSGKDEAVHSVLFSNTMAGLGLDPAYGRYLDALPGPTLATVNLMSLFGLHHKWRGACVGHLVAFEVTSPEPNRRYGNALRRLGFGHPVTLFYDEHVEADSMHEAIALHDLAESLVADAPEFLSSVLFGVKALLEVEKRWALRVMDCWASGASSLFGTPATLSTA